VNKMSASNDKYLAFKGSELIKSGSLLSAALAYKEDIQTGSGASILIFNAMNGKQVDVDIRGSHQDIENRYQVMEPQDSVEVSDAVTEKKRGRPKLGVVGREVTLLPRHWQWLDEQPGGASATLRRLVETARKQGSAEEIAKKAQAATLNFMSAIAGNLEGFEEAVRALYADKKNDFETQISSWPKDIKQTVLRFSELAFK
jgi:hypothetical protein